MSKFKLTSEYLNSLIIKEEYREFTAGGKTFISCLLWVSPNFAVVGEPAAAMYPENHDPVEGRKAARRRSFEKMWELESYRHLVNEHRHTGGNLEARIRRIEAALNITGSETPPMPHPVVPTPEPSETQDPVNPPGNELFVSMTTEEEREPFELTPEISRILVRLEDLITNACGSVMKLKPVANVTVFDEEIRAFAQYFQDRLEIEMGAPGFDADSFDVYAFCRNTELYNFRVEADILNRSNTGWVDTETTKRAEDANTPPAETIKPIIVGDSLLQGFRVKEYMQEFDQAMADIKKTLSQRAILSVDFDIRNAADEMGLDIYWDLAELKQRFDDILPSTNFSVSNVRPVILEFLQHVFQLPQENFELRLMS